MARRRYPSDQRPYFRVLDDILDCPKLASLEPADAWAFLRLLASFNRARVRGTDLELSLPSVRGALGKRRDRTAFELLDRLQGAGLITWSSTTRQPLGNRGVTTRIRIAKWPKIQGFAPSLRGEESHSSSGSSERSTVRRAPTAALPPDGARAPSRNRSPEALAEQRALDAVRQEARRKPKRTGPVHIGSLIRGLAQP